MKMIHLIEMGSTELLFLQFGICYCSINLNLSLKNMLKVLGI